MNEALLLVALLSAIVASAILAQRLRIPYPVAFVVVGLILAFFPGLPQPRFDPQLLFLIVLPPLLFSGGWNTDWFAFRRNLRPITLYAVVLVIVTTFVVAALAHSLAGYGWAAAFVLGAIVSPPDAVAAEAVFERLAVPRRIVAVLTGEALVNDGTALVIYRFALLAFVTGTFSLASAPLAFVFNIVGGVLCGLAIGLVIELVLRVLARFELDDATISNVVFLLAPYAAYLPADALNVSGVLSAVTAGIYSSRRAQTIMSSEERLIASAVWRVMLLVLNGLVFLLIGLELPGIVRALPSLATAAIFGLGISLVLIVLRMAWAYPAAWLPRLIPQIRARDPLPSWRWIFVIGWSGMRGIVSLAAALALPYTDAHGAPLIHRSEIIFATLCVIVVTLVLQGLSLDPLIRALGISETHQRQSQETAIRIRALQEGERYLRSVEPEARKPGEMEAVGRLLGEYQRRIEQLQGRLDDEGPGEARDERESDRRLELAALDAERREITQLRREGKIPDDIFSAIEYDLDLAGLRLR
ncbi:MAG TPA: Na+/H+ antiporter [Candidatus Baltobacteraceae bacterium]|nr:Na+/H+ antiporter [Candidatus Baltobacteraceae bacterium]